MTGRGERIQPIEPRQAKVYKQLKLLVFKPSFSINTAWAYGEMKGSQGHHYSDQASVLESAWLEGECRAPYRLFNSLEAPVFKKYPALPMLLDVLRDRFNLPCLMSGSGSSCFAILNETVPTSAVVEVIQECWGEHTFIIETSLL